MDMKVLLLSPYSVKGKIRLKFNPFEHLPQHFERISPTLNKLIKITGGLVIQQNGRAIAQAVRRRLPAAAARVQNRVWSCGIL
jgi:hypothetical protein